MSLWRSLVGRSEPIPPTYRDDDSMRRLEEAVADVQNIPFPIPVEGGYGRGDWTEHEMECGICWSRNLKNTPEISVAEFINTSGSRFPLHTHEQREWLIIFHGSMHLAIFDDDGEEEEFRLMSGVSRIIDPNIAHRKRFLEDCRYIAITIPQSPDWPT